MGESNNYCVRMNSWLKTDVSRFPILGCREFEDIAKNQCSEKSDTDAKVEIDVV